MTSTTTRCIFIFFVSILSHTLIGQTISGTLSYTQTRATAFHANNAEVTVINSTGFAIEDKVLIIQMQGAVVNTSNSSSFGDVTDYNGAGAYETATVCWVNGNQVIFENELLNDYDPSGIVQVIKIPQYDNLIINGTLTSPAWDGSAGGVLVLEAKTIDLQADIDMSEKGFRGAAMEDSDYNCTWVVTSNDYYYDNPGRGAPKGEGIVDLPGNISYGKGAAANGGGGGNDHNSGGGGGGNIGSGGPGGTNGATGVFDCKGNHPGVGGKGLTSTNRIFLGGGGGAGHGNNEEATSGGTGGGIIILISPFLVGNGYSIRSNGESALDTSYGAGDAGGDGAGAGGAGGSVHLDITNISGNLTVEVVGGDGGDVIHTDGGNRCFGPGGGGSGGMIKASGAIPGSVTMTITAGVNGVNGVLGSGTTSCLGSAESSAPGNVGIVLPGVGAVPASNVDYTGCDVLPVELLSFEAIGKESSVEVLWSTQTEFNNDFFIVEKSKDGRDFESLVHIQGAGNSFNTQKYTYTDLQPLDGISYYRLVTVDFDGTRHYSAVRAVQRFGEIDLNVFPNPGKTGSLLNLAFGSHTSGSLELEVLDMVGGVVISQIFEFQKGENQLSVSTFDLPSGTYMIRLESRQFVATRKWILAE
ncbi:MAG: T9SS C-terminal target domain-containing protein [Bacteroidetes bacterium]|nr:MAG: T9SS C-terminal target domain-containing protein [Bacteroidota bacterium]